MPERQVGWRVSCQVHVGVSMKLKKQVTVCGAAIFCVAVFSLYLMLDRVQHDPARHQSGGNFPRVSHTLSSSSNASHLGLASSQLCQDRTKTPSPTPWSWGVLLEPRARMQATAESVAQEHS